jgi:hypothetical protein
LDGRGGVGSLDGACAHELSVRQGGEWSS